MDIETVLRDLRCALGGMVMLDDRTGVLSDLDLKELHRMQSRLKQLTRDFDEFSKP